ncbi:MAG: SPOR domain-containing protein [Bacteroidota bacterium]
MRLFTLLLACLLLLPSAYAGGEKKKKGGDKDKNKEQYYKYEREEVAAYRDRRNFEMPPPPEPVEVEPEVVSPQASSLEPYFMGGRKVYLDVDPRLRQLVARDSVLKGRIDKLPGYRVQIYANVGRQRALATKSTLMSAYPDVPNYLTYRAPNYVVRVGDFIDKEEAELFCRKLKETFPSAFVAPDNINFGPPEREEKEDDQR